MWKSTGRKLELSAQVVKGYVQGEIFPNIKFGLNGRKLLLSVKEVCLSYTYKNKQICKICSVFLMFLLNLEK